MLWREVWPMEQSRARLAPTARGGEGGGGGATLRWARARRFRSRECTGGRASRKCLFICLRCFVRLFIYDQPGGRPASQRGPSTIRLLNLDYYYRRHHHQQQHRRDGRAPGLSVARFWARAHTRACGQCQARAHDEIVIAARKWPASKASQPASQPTVSAPLGPRSSHRRPLGAAIKGARPAGWPPQTSVVEMCALDKPRRPAEEIKRSQGGGQWANWRPPPPPPWLAPQPRNEL